MPGGIQYGTVARSVESMESEYNHKKWIDDVVSELQPEYEVLRKVPISRIIHKEPEYALDKKGESQYWFADGGFILKNGKLIGVAENKYQASGQNACERVFRYLSFLNGNQIFISCYGERFKKQLGGQSTGSTIELLKYSGAHVIENVDDEQTFKEEFLTWISSL